MSNDFDAFHREMMDTTEIDFLPVAKTTKAYYEALKTAGFTSPQSLELTKAYIMAMISTAIGRKYE